MEQLCVSWQRSYPRQLDCQIVLCSLTLSWHAVLSTTNSTQQYFYFDLWHHLCPTGRDSSTSQSLAYCALSQTAPTRSSLMPSKLCQFGCYLRFYRYYQLHRTDSTSFSSGSCSLHVLAEAVSEDLKVVVSCLYSHLASWRFSYGLMLPNLDRF